MSFGEQKRQLVAEVEKSLRRIQEFEATSIARGDELGRDLNFQEAVPHGERIIELFRQVSLDILGELSDQRLNTLKQVADAEYNRFQQILKFSVTDQNPKATRDALIQQIGSAYDAVFEQIWPATAYSVRRATDFARLEREARASIQAITDRTAELEATLAKRKEEADAALDAIRKVAAEHGVSQQAIYFREEAEEHGRQAGLWLRRTVWLTVGLGVYAAATLFFHKVPWLVPTNSLEMVQLAVSKILVFATIASFLVLSARNYMAHRHNAVVNRHRQNSLVTYRALVEAAGDQANRDIVLTKAAECIFGAQSTGFSKTEGGEGAALSMVNVSPSLLKPPPAGG